LLNKRITYQYSLIAFLAIAGLIGSLTHYHSEGLECLDHAEEQHYVQNENFCPICTLVVSADFEVNNSAKAYLLGEEYFFFYNEDITPTTPIYSDPGRAPPFMA